MIPHEQTDAQIALAVRDWLEQGVSALPDGMQLPTPVRDQIITQLPTTPQRRRWWTDRWSTRGHGVMRSDGVPGHRDGRRSRRMFGFATLLAAGAIGGAALLAGINQQTSEPGPRTIVVAQDGSGDVATITEGVALAVDGDTVLIRPGVYEESPIIEQDVVVRGDGARDAIVVEGTTGGAGITESEGPYSLVLRDSDATIEHLTIRGMAGMVVVLGGAPVLQDLMFEGTGIPYGSSDPCTDERGCSSTLMITSGSTATVRDSLFVGGGDIIVDGDAAPLIAGNELTDGPHFYLSSAGDATVIRDNTVSGAIQWAIGIFDADTRVLIEGNRLSARSIGINASSGFPTIQGNEIEGAWIGMDVGAVAVIERNEVHDNLSGILVRSNGAVVRGNIVSSNKTVGIDVLGAADPSIVDNRIEGNGTGIRVGAGSTPTIKGNALCANGVDHEAVPPAPLPPDNTACDVAPASVDPSLAP